ncbi:MAG TPA: ATP-dependent helicase [Rhodanobacteraceae bacterium]|nr:ATP-dependent helicase [Rhodanobacteraceae bacterium]
MLNAAQRRGVEAPGHALISACPGSGKTTVLSRRAAFLLEGNPGARLAAVTFTNDAAEELAQRIGKQCPGAEQRIVAGTFHKLAKTQLLDSKVRIVLASEAQAAEFRRRAASSVERGAQDIEDVMAGIEAEKAKMVTGEICGTGATAKACRAYQTLMAERGLMDFQDLLISAVDGMAKGTVKPLPVQYLLVDEVQDADPVQWAWVLAHARTGVRVTTVGDDDQAIYGWRSASGYAGMMGFVEATGAEHIQLDVTYRCAPEILSAAARLIRQNPARVEKSLVTANPNRGEVRLVRSPKRKDEAEQVAEQIARNGPPHSWAVLARSNALLDHVEAALNILRIPIHRIGGRSLWDRPGAELFLGALAALAKNSVLCVDLLASKAGVKAERLDHLNRMVNSRRKDSLDRFVALPASEVEGEEALTSLHALMGQWQEFQRSQSIRLLAEGVSIWMESRIGARHLSTDMKRCSETFSKLKGSILQRLQYLREDRKVLSRGVTLMTLHASKGLEFDRVWMIACERGVLPHKSSGIEEERRLAYVGMTRARIELVMSYSADEKSHPSPFLFEAGLLPTT